MLYIIIQYLDKHFAFFPSYHLKLSQYHPSSHISHHREDGDNVVDTTTPAIDEQVEKHVLFRSRER